MDADLQLSLIYGTSSSGIILAPRRKRAGVFLKGGVRHNRNIGYKSHLTFLFLPGFSGSGSTSLNWLGKEMEVGVGPRLPRKPGT